MSENSEEQPVGRVLGLWRYPVKSMAGEALTESDVAWHGLPGDRRWAFVRNDDRRSTMPWLTLRERADLNRYRPSFVDSSRPDTSRTDVATPSGAVLAVDDPALGAELFPGGARAIKYGCGVFDTFPLSLITTQTIARLGEIVGQRLAVQRFRPNILVETADETPFAEDAWVGQTLRLGSVRMRVDKRDGRCVVISIDPATGERNPAILRAVTAERQGCLGVYGTTVEPGRVAVGDTLWVDPCKTRA